MKVSVKLSFALALIIAVFISSFALVGMVTQREIKLQQTERSKDREIFIQNILQLKGSLLETFAYDYTYWDDMVSFLQTADKVWAEQNIDEGMSTYQTALVQVYRLDHSLAYSTGQLSKEKSVSQFSMPEALLKKLETERFIYFFTRISSHLLEVRGATIHPTADRERKTPPRGFFFAYKLWDEKEIQSLSELTASEVSLEYHAAAKISENSYGIFRIPLEEWDGRQFGEVVFSAKFSLLDRLRKNSNRYFSLIILFSMILLMGAFFMVHKWVSLPLSKIEKSLNKKDVREIENLKKDSTEFGRIAVLIEDRERLQSAVLQSEKMAAVGQLAGGVAHEINNPLGVILGFAQNVVKRIPPGDPLELPLKSIEREAVRCKNLVHDLLMFSRASKIEKELIDVSHSIEGALSLVLAHSRIKNVELIREFAKDLPKMRANHNQLQQVIVNLSNNAIDAMPTGGKLFIRTRKGTLNKGAAIEIQIEDTGSGIPEEIQSKIFEPFFTTKEIGKGTGLGLSLVYEIIQKHNGQITVHSEGGKGTTFSILLPLNS